MNEREFQERCRKLVDHEVYYCMTSWVEWAREVGGGETCPIDVDEIPCEVACETCRGTGYEVYEDEDGCPYDDLNDETLRKAWREEEISDDEISERMDSLEWPRAECGQCEGEWIAVDGFATCNECEEGRVTIEIYEWLAVTPWLASQLEDRGEVVISNGFDYLWGRQTTGQAIMMDGVIQEIRKQQDRELEELLS